MDKQMIPKYKKDGKIAILYSPGYGAGFSTWCQKKEQEKLILFDPDIVELVLKRDLEHEKLDKYNRGIEQELNIKLMKDVNRALLTKYGIETLADSLEVMWLNEGELFYVQEYDGNESIVCGEENWIVA